jgi:hypothetical protein
MIPSQVPPQRDSNLMPTKSSLGANTTHRLLPSCSAMVITGAVASCGTTPLAQGGRIMMLSALGTGCIFGINPRIDWSWLFVSFLLT